MNQSGFVSVFILLVTTSTIAFFSLFSLYKEATIEIQRGDLYLQQNKLNEALERYAQAQELWPLFKFNDKLNLKVNEINDIKKNNSDKEYLVVYFKDKTFESQINSLTDDIKQLGSGISVKFLSKTDAYEEFKRFNQDNFQVMRLIIPDAFSDSLHIELKNTKLKNKIIKTAKAKSFVDNVLEVSKD